MRTSRLIWTVAVLVFSILCLILIKDSFKKHTRVEKLKNCKIKKTEVKLLVPTSPPVTQYLDTNSISSCSNKRLWPHCDEADSDTICKSLKIPDLKSHQEDRLPPDIVSGVKYFVIFLGHARSGSSITGSLMDAHPNMVICHEYSILHQLSIHPTTHNSKEDIFDNIFIRTQELAKHFQKVERKGYSLDVKNSWKGTYKDKVMVIGDKSAAPTTALYLADSSRFAATLDRLREITKVPLKFVHVVRNPYDNIATNLIYKLGGVDLRLQLLANNRSSADSSEDKLTCEIKKYFDHYYAIEKMKARLQLDVLEIHLSDLVQSPLRELTRICLFLDIECSSSYLKAGEESVFSEVSKTREKFQWTASQKDLTAKFINSIPALKRYTFQGD